MPRIRIGHSYMAQLSKKTSPVLIESTHEGGGWIVRSLETGRVTRLKDRSAILGPCVATELDFDIVPLRRAKPKAAKPAFTLTTAPNAKARKIHETSTDESTPFKEPRKLTLLDAAYQVLTESGTEMTCGAIIQAVIERKLWSTNGTTPANTLHAAINRDIQKQGKESRFYSSSKTRGKFAAHKVPH